ncbi:MAG: GGDEF domain-containing protein, partial [Lachnospiraceae bacterium]|nr:GGDEF domain-containing protein [Lachnospiraceae bacterium]
MEQNADCTDTVAILYVDLDHFKYYNDTFGHDVGDVVLKEFSRVFLEVAKDQGYVVRYGGDEFLIILNHTDVDGAKEVAENIYDRIRDGFAEQLNAYVGRPIRIPKEMQISCSIGIVESEDAAIEHVETALKRADEALYYMKRQGKGGYMVWNGM